jgi:hypothetical protein
LQYQGLRNDVDGLRQQIAVLTDCVTTLVEKRSQPTISTQGQNPLSPYTITGSRNSAIPRNGSPEQPQFIGPTRSDFSFNIAETTIARMDIGQDKRHAHLPASPATSREHTPEHASKQHSPPYHRATDGLSGFTCAELVRLLEIYHEEIACIHPIVDAKDLIQHASRMFDLFKERDTWSAEVQLKDIRNVHMIKIAIATALIHETHGKNADSDSLIASVEQDVSVISLAHAVDLKDIQVMGMLVRPSQVSASWPC